MNIVKEIIDITLEELQTALPNFAPADYFFNLEANESRGKSKRFAFTEGNIEFRESVGRAEVEQTFTLKLLDSFINIDTDEKQRAALSDLYNNLQTALGALVRKRFTFSSSNNRLLLVRPDSVKEPTFIDENTVVVLEADIIFRYKTIL